MNTPLSAAHQEPQPAEEAGPVAPDPQLAFEEAFLLEREGRLAEAESLYRELLLAYPGSAPILHNLGLLLRAQGRLIDAEACARSAIQADANKPTYHNSLAVILRGLGRWDEAESCYRQALELWSAYPEARFNLGLLLELEGKLEEAAAEFQQALACKPDYVQARGRLAAVLQRLGRPGEALQLLEETPGGQASFEIEYYRGAILTELRRHEEAVQALARATALRPDSLDAALATANALREAGRLDQALAAYWLALELRPDRLATHDEINRLAWMAARQDYYLRSFAYVRERRGPDAELLQLEAAFRLRGGDLAQAEQLLREARRLAPGRGDIAGLLARTLVGQRRFEESYPLFVEAVSAEPAALRHRIEFGFALLQDRQPGQAHRVFEQALQAAPFDQMVLAGLSLVYRELEDTRYHALVDFERYVRVYDLQGPQGARDAGRFNRALAEELDRLHTAKVEPIDQTLRGGTQSTGRLFEERLPMVQHLRQSVEAAVRDYIKQVPANAWHPVALRKAAEVRFAGSWSCRLGSGGYHHNHVHPKGWLSSAYYVRLPQQVEDATHRSGWLKFGESNLSLGPRDLAHHALKPVVGRLVLFPSYFWHGTVPFADNGDRLAIAFDVAPGPGAAPPMNVPNQAHAEAAP